MTYSTHQACNPLRQVPLIQPRGRIFGMSQADRLRVALATAEQHRKTLLASYAHHCAALGRANAVSPKSRREEKSRAFKYINLTRAALRSNAREVAKLQADLLALASTREAA